MLSLKQKYLMKNNKYLILKNDKERSFYLMNAGLLTTYKNNYKFFNYFRKEQTMLFHSIYFSTFER